MTRLKARHIVVVASVAITTLVGTSAWAEDKDGSTTKAESATVQVIGCANEGDKCWGTGVVVDTTPPTIATCFHVVSGVKTIRLYSPSVPEVSQLTVDKIASFVEYDIAFLRVSYQGKLVNDWKFGPALRWTSPDAVVAKPGTRFEFYGASDWLTDGLRIPQSVVKQKNFLNLSTLFAFAELSLTVDPRLIEIAGDPDVPYGGDSGAPLVVPGTDKVVGLIAGKVQMVINNKDRFFAVPATVKPPPATHQLWKQPGAVSGDPYGGVGSVAVPRVHSLLARMKVVDYLPEEYRPSAKELSEKRECPALIGALIARYDGERDHLPTPGKKGAPQCPQYTAGLLADLRSEGEIERKLNRAKALRVLLSQLKDRLNAVKADDQLLKDRSDEFDREVEKLETQRKVARSKVVDALTVSDTATKR